MSFYAQVPDIKAEIGTMRIVLVDEEAIGPVDTPGCGAKILLANGEHELLFHDTRFTDRMVCFPNASFE